MWVKKIVPSDLAGCQHVFWWLEVMYLKVLKSFFRTYGLDFSLVGILEGHEVLNWRRTYTVLSYLIFTIFSKFGVFENCRLIDLFESVRQMFGAHNRASAPQNRAPAPKNRAPTRVKFWHSYHFSFEMRNQSKPGFHSKLGLQIWAWKGCISWCKKKKTPLKFREFLSVSSLGCKEDMFQFSLVKNSLLFF